MRGNGHLTRKQLKGLLVSLHPDQIVPDSDISAILRRMDTDGDTEISFSDFFSSLLPYFIYGDLQPQPTKNYEEAKMNRHRQKSENKSLMNIQVNLPRPFSTKSRDQRKENEMFNEESN
jgi:hypothetical protein